MLTTLIVFEIWGVVMTLTIYWQLGGVAVIVWLLLLFTIARVLRAVRIRKQGEAI